jgi:hypothetical protein
MSGEQSFAQPSGRRRRGRPKGSRNKATLALATEMALHVLAYNLTRVINILGVNPLMAAIRAQPP